MTATAPDNHTPSLREQLAPLASFARRAHLFVTGREKLHRGSRGLAFVLITEDISENSRREVLERIACPIYQALTAADVEALFGLANAKIVGFRKNGLSDNLAKSLQPFLVVPQARHPAQSTPNQQGDQYNA